MADVADDRRDLAAKEDQGDDRNDRDEGEDQGVFGQSLAIFAGTARKPEPELMNVRNSVMGSPAGCRAWVAGLGPSSEPAVARPIDEIPVRYRR